LTLKKEENKMPRTRKIMKTQTKPTAKKPYIMVNLLPIAMLLLGLVIIIEAGYTLWLTTQVSAAGAAAATLAQIMLIYRVFLVLKLVAGFAAFGYGISEFLKK
jgi:phosphoglycerol transferase MdoB-like AlkP superfamily enzyme